MRAARDLGHDVMILALNWLLNKHGVIWFQGFDEDFRQSGTDGAMKVDGDVGVVAGGLPELGEFLGRVVNFRRCFQVSGRPAFGRSRLERGEALAESSLTRSGVPA
jgi:hypothetical protein